MLLYVCKGWLAIRGGIGAAEAGGDEMKEQTLVVRSNVQDERRIQICGLRHIAEPSELILTYPVFPSKWPLVVVHEYHQV